MTSGSHISLVNLRDSSGKSGGMTKQSKSFVASQKHWVGVLVYIEHNPCPWQVAEIRQDSGLCVLSHCPATYGLVYNAPKSHYFNAAGLKHTLLPSYFSCLLLQSRINTIPSDISKGKDLLSRKTFRLD